MIEKQVTPEMIDHELVQRIAAETSSTHKFGISEVLAWLANHPILLQPPQIRGIWESYGIRGNEAVHLSSSCEIGFILQNYARIAYLKKEPELPQEVKSLLWEGNPFPNTGAQNRHDQAVIAAYWIGKGEAK